MTSIKIYTNDGEGHYWRGFDPEHAELTMVMSTEISDFPGINPKDVKIVDRVLHYVFEETNIGTTSNLAVAWRRKLLRSLSKGDVVVVGETAFACASVGWDKITTDELNGAIIWDDELGRCPV